MWDGCYSVPKQTYIKSISTAANWWLIQPLSATSQLKRGRALSDRKYPKDVYVCVGLGLYIRFFSP